MKLKSYWKIKLCLRIKIRIYEHNEYIVNLQYEDLYTIPSHLNVSGSSPLVKDVVSSKDIFIGGVILDLLVKKVLVASG